MTKVKTKPKSKFIQVKFAEDDLKLLKIEAHKVGVMTLAGMIRVAVKNYLLHASN